jgi:hypothetical protein
MHCTKIPTAEKGHEVNVSPTGVFGVSGTDVDGVTGMKVSPIRFGPSAARRENTPSREFSTSMTSFKVLTGPQFLIPPLLI